MGATQRLRLMDGSLIWADSLQIRQQKKKTGNKANDQSANEPPYRPDDQHNDLRQGKQQLREPHGPKGPDLGATHEGTWPRYVPEFLRFFEEFNFNLIRWKCDLISVIFV